MKPDTMMRIIIFITVLAGLLGAVGYFLYTLFLANIVLENKRQQETVLSEAAIERNYAELSEKLLAGTAATPTDVIQGFWYRYIDERGIEQVIFLDMSILAKKGLTEWQMDNLTKRIADSRISTRDTVSLVSVDDMPSEYQFHNALYKRDKDAGFIKGKESLEGRVALGEYTANDLFRLAYIYEIEGKYHARDELNTKSCKEFAQRCTKNVDITISGMVVDNNGVPIQSAQISVISATSEQEVIVRTDGKGMYEINLAVQKMEKVRLRAYKRNYSDGIVSAVIITETRENYPMDTIVLSSPVNRVTIDTGARTVTGDGNTYTNDIVMLHTSHSTYEIPTRAIVHEDGSEYVGEIDVYLYEFTNSDEAQSLLTVDTMDDTIGYAGDMMQSFGMPYIQFFNPEGEELHVMKSHPMNIRYMIANMDELYDTESGYRALTDLDMELMIRASQGSTYPIDREFLMENDLLHFPAFWVFDRTVGIWENVGINIITTDGLIESTFYTTNDGR